MHLKVLFADYHEEITEEDFGKHDVVIRVSPEKRWVTVKNSRGKQSFGSHYNLARFIAKLVLEGSQGKNVDTEIKRPHV